MENWKAFITICAADLVVEWRLEYNKTAYFNKERVTENLFHFMGEKPYLPHGVTVNEYLERLDSEELQKVKQKQVYELIWRKTFDNARFHKNGWQKK